MMQEIRFRAMGTDCHVLVEALDENVETTLLTLAVERVELLEQSWSRFRPTSELSRLNARAGSGPIEVSADLLLLVTRMSQAWRESDGLFDPTVLDSMNRLGYDADFAEVSTRVIPAASDIAVLPAPGMGGVRTDAATMTVTLPAGVGLDPGAIGKGLAADIVVEELLGIGASAVLVNLGGDIAIGGALIDPWRIAVTDERLPRDIDERTLEVIELPRDVTRAGIATSTTLKRRWAEGLRHHVIDPRTGSMATGSYLQATVIAPQAWQAEVAASIALLRDDAAAWLEEQHVDALLLTPDNTHITGALASATPLGALNG
jgi:thiamine biosynthesis lipoprotein